MTTAIYTHNARTALKSAPRTTLVQAVAKIIDNHRIDVANGIIYGRDGVTPIGSDTYEPRVSVRVAGKKYNARVHKVIGFVMYGAAALKRGNRIVHRDKNKFNNSGVNLRLLTR